MSIQADVKKRLFTVDEYYRMAEVGILDPDARVELIEGEILEMSPVGTRHVACVNRAYALFAREFEGKGIVSVQNPVRLNTYNEPQPDIVLLRPRDDYYEGKRIAWEDALLVIEISDSTIRRDRDLKLPIYARSGVSELWIEDLRHDTLLVYRDPGPKTYSTFLALHRGDFVSLSAFPDIVLKVEELI